VLKHEIDSIIETGVETKMNTKVGVDVSMEKLEKDYDAVLFAVGAMSGRSLPIPGGEAGNINFTTSFLAITSKIVINTISRNTRLTNRSG
jgi:NADPH-dependent glutamate synthase beta subunit-like oxidoreductase